MAEYIDRDEYKKVLMRYLQSHQVWTGTWVSEGMRIAIQGCCELLDNEPAADVEEVKHGRWKEAHIIGEQLFGYDPFEIDVFSCSLCGAQFDISEALNYCPNCGAKMDGGEDETK